MPTLPHNIAYTITSSQGTAVDTVTWSEATFSDLYINLDESIPGGSTDLEVTYALTFANVRSFIMWADRAMTIDTNSSSVPDDTFILVAGQPIVYHLNGAPPNAAILTADITSLFVTLAAGAASVLHIRASASA